MVPRKLLVKTPARLHFGLFSFGNTGRQFGGVGVMVQRPRVEVEFRPALRFAVEGPLEARVRQVVKRWSEKMEMPDLPGCRVSVRTNSQRHVGLGSGTQLALSIAAGLNAWHQLVPPTAGELVRLTGRGGRSAIGTYGFLHGGLIVESGKLLDEEMAPLQRRVPFPESWRWVLVRVRETAGLHGDSERAAFENLPPVGPEVRADLQREVAEEMVPALIALDFRGFSESIYRFGYRAGMCFASVQGGPYNGSRVAAMVETIRALGVRGVGQSSWGPTLFCALPDQASAETFARQLQECHLGEDLDVCVTAADNQGAQIVVE